MSSPATAAIAGLADGTLDPSTVFRVVDIAGIAANGILGGAAARTMGFDLVGFTVLGVTAGLGGGVIRDVLLGYRPAALTDPFYLIRALAAALVAYLLDLRGRRATRVLLLLDVLALGCWSATGSTKALAAGLSWLPALFLGVVTAIGGGMVRDVLVGKVPPILGYGSPLYATVAALGAGEATALTLLGHPQAGMGLSIVTCGILGALARRRGWTLPGATDLRPRAMQHRLSARGARRVLWSGGSKRRDEVNDYREQEHG